MSLGRRSGLVVLAACVACGLFAAPASATFHEIKIREVALGNGGIMFQDAYFELQAYAPGQNLLGSHRLTLYNASGTPATNCTFPGPVGNSANQMTVLVAGSMYSGSPPADLSCPISGISGVGGAVCWGTDQPAPLDCMSWGSFSGTLGSPTGTPGPTPANGTALRRSISAGCPTLLESADDTNNTVTDLQSVAASPRNSASPITETACKSGAGGKPNTKIKKRPKNRSGDNSPTFKFTATELYSKFKCKLDNRPFRSCKSPKTFHGLDPGKHSFKVKAIDSDGNLDATPAKDSFKIVGSSRTGQAGPAPGPVY